MKKKVTIRDIAQEIGVSTGTVHRAIYGNKGVGDELRARILDLCCQRGYHVSPAAPALRNGPLRIIAAFPEPRGPNRYYYSSVWRGFERYMQQARSYNVEVVRCPYAPGTDRSEGAVLFQAYKQYHGDIAALITVGHFDALTRQVVESYTSQNIPLFLVCDDAPDCGRLCCVQADYYRTGRVVAELLESQLPAGSTVLLCTGQADIVSHQRTVEGFRDYNEKRGTPLHVIEVPGYEDELALSIRLFDLLEKNPGITGAFCVSARLSILLADQLRDLGLEGRVRMVASDLFPENVRNMKAGLVRNILFKDPGQQAWLAAKIMMDYLLRFQPPAHEVEYVNSHIIFRSDLAQYCQNCPPDGAAGPAADILTPDEGRLRPASRYHQKEEPRS